MWRVRKALASDVEQMVSIARNYDSFLMPYALSSFILGNLLEDIVVVTTEERSKVVGYLHYFNSDQYSALAKPSLDDIDKVISFLVNVKLVPSDIITNFLRSQKPTIFIAQVVCPEGSFTPALDYVYSKAEEVWCWTSVNAPSFPSYQRRGFVFGSEYTFWNIYKGGYSTFSLGRYKTKKED